MSTLQWHLDLLAWWVQRVDNLWWCEEAFILGGVPAFIAPLVDEPFVPEHRPEMLHCLSVSLLCGPYEVCIWYVAGTEEVFESLRDISAECQGILSCCLSSLLNFQAMFICTWNMKMKELFTLENPILHYWHHMKSKRRLRFMEQLPVTNFELNPFSSLYLCKQSAITAEYRCPRWGEALT